MRIINQLLRVAAPLPPQSPPRPVVIAPPPAPMALLVLPKNDLPELTRLATKWVPERCRNIWLALESAKRETPLSRGIAMQERSSSAIASALRPQLEWMRDHLGETPERAQIEKLLQRSTLSLAEVQESARAFVLLADDAERLRHGLPSMFVDKWAQFGGQNLVALCSAAKTAMSKIAAHDATWYPEHREMSVEDLLRMSLVNAYPVGLTTRVEHADERDMPPLAFFMHDVNHAVSETHFQDSKGALDRLRVGDAIFTALQAHPQREQLVAQLFEAVHEQGSDWDPVMLAETEAGVFPPKDLTSLHAFVRSLPVYTEAKRALIARLDSPPTDDRDTFRRALLWHQSDDPVVRAKVKAMLTSTDAIADPPYGSGFVALYQRIRNEALAS